MLLNNLKIYVQIASYMDLELYPTVEDVLEKARYPNNLFLSIYSQDEDHPDLSPIFDKYPGVKYKYQKVPYLRARGVGHARAAANKFLTNDYGFYLQVDSHSRFVTNWDEKIITDYLNLHDHWGKMLFSSYPPAYEGEERDYQVTALQILPPEEYGIPFDKKYTEYEGESLGQESGYMCGGLLFGYTKYVLEVPYDPNIYFEGEEHSMSVRLFEKGTRIICPPGVYLFHDYEGSRRKRHWEMDPMWSTFNDLSRIRVRHLFDGIVKDKYGFAKPTIQAFLDKFLPTTNYQ